MSKIDSGLGWSCDSNYYIDTVQTLVTFPNSDTISKANAGACLVGAFKNTNSPPDYGVIMASPNNTDLAALAKNAGGAISLNTTTETYDGVTWYIAWAYSTNSTYSRTQSYHTENLTLLETLISPGSTNRAQGLITESGFEFTAKKLPTTDYVKAFVEGVEAETATRVNANKEAIGVLSNLTTTEKTDLVSAINELESTKQSKTASGILTTRSKPYVKIFEPITWNGLTSANGNYVWTDGENIYLSSLYVLDRSTSTWTTKTWNGLTSFDGKYIWTDGENIYYSLDSDQYVLNKSTSTWEPKTWNGLTSANGIYVWTDGENIYHSIGDSQYVLNKSTSTWTEKAWNGLTTLYGDGTWTDGENIYYSYFANSQYILNGSTWTTKTWNGFTNLYGNYVWTDGENIYYSSGSSSGQYVLNGSTWETINAFPSNMAGECIWTDGENIYYSSGTTQYILKKYNISARK